MIYFNKEILSYLKTYKNKYPIINKIYSLISSDGSLNINTSNSSLSNLVKIEHVTLKEMEKTYNVIKLIFNKPDGTEYFQIWRCGRFLKILYENLFKSEITDEDLEILTSVILGKETFRIYIEKNNYSLEITEEISKYYSTNNYVKITGSLGKSCMNNNEKTQFYDYFKKIVNLVILKDKSSNKILGRSLLWKTDKGYYLDRIYVIDNLLIFGFDLYARYLFNIPNSYYYMKDPYITSSIKIEEIEGFIDFPFLDTMSYINIDINNKIVHFSNKPHNKDFIYIPDLDYKNLRDYINELYKLSKIKISYKPIDIDDLKDEIRYFKYVYNDKDIEFIKDIFSMKYVIGHFNSEYEYTTSVFRGYLIYLKSLKYSNKTYSFFILTYKDEYYANIEKYIHTYKEINKENLLGIWNMEYESFTDFEYLDSNILDLFLYIKINCNYIPVILDLFKRYPIAPLYFDYSDINPFYRILDENEVTFFINSYTKETYIVINSSATIDNILKFDKDFTNNIDEVIDFSSMTYDEIKEFLSERLNKEYIITFNAEKIYDIITYEKILQFINCT